LIDASFTLLFGAIVVVVHIVCASVASACVVDGDFVVGTFAIGVFAGGALAVAGGTIRINPETAGTVTVDVDVVFVGASGALVVLL
jgi:hypothetical protein